MESPSTYQDEGWLYDLSQVRGAAIALLLGVVGFAATFAVSLSHHSSSGSVVCTTHGACGNALSAYGFLLSALTLVCSAVGVFAGVYTASQNRHRVRKFAWACAFLSAANLLGFMAFIIVLSA